MAGLKRYDLAFQVLEKYRGEIMFLETLKSILRKHLTGNEKTITDYLFLMRNTELIKEIPASKEGVTKWEILPNE